MVALPHSGLWQRVLPISVRAWHHIISLGLAPDRTELIRGVMLEKVPKCIIHTKLAARVFALLQQLTGMEMWVRKEDPLTLADSEPEPDISVVRGKKEDFQCHPSSAELVVEVSVSSVGEDRMLAALYAEAAVAEYWIVNGKERCIEVYHDPANGRYETQLRVVEGGVLECAVLPGVRVDVAELFAGIGA